MQERFLQQQQLPQDQEEVEYDEKVGWQQKQMQIL
jgi:hypothetical protein